MHDRTVIKTMIVGLAALFSAPIFTFYSPALAATICEGYGPQAPRDISNGVGENRLTFAIAPPSSELNLCNIHVHTNAEHKGPGFPVLANSGGVGGYRCSGSDELSKADLKEPEKSSGAYGEIKPGDTIEVHWVFSSCDIEPGVGLASCLSDKCQNAELRVESQVFLMVNDPEALDFADFAYQGNVVNGLRQPKSLPEGTGEPVEFIGSTTGPTFTQQVCSPMQVTWNVRPECARLNINSLNAWGKNGNVFKESEPHGVRQLVTDARLLAPIR